MTDISGLSREKLPGYGFIVVTACLVLTVFIGFLDYATGYEMDFFLFYFLPIAISAWFVGRWAAFSIVLLSVVTWLFADMLSNHQPSFWFIEWWNTGIQALTFSLVAVTLCIIRKAFDRKDELNANLSETLHKLEEASRKRLLAEQEIMRQNEFLSHIFESLTHPFYVVDAEDYTVTMANSTTIPGGLPRGTTCYSLTHQRSEPCSGSEHLCPMQQVKNTKQPFSTEHIHYDKEGSARHFEIHAYPVLDNAKNVTQVIEYALDITRRKQLEDILRNNAEKIKLFAYSVSHDLKSPLVGIGGLTRLLHEQYRDSLDERGRTYCDQIRKASENALRLIEEINVFIRAKEAPMVFEAINPKEIFETIRHEFDPLLDARGIEWSEPESFPEVTADRISLLRVFRNLVDNALKYGGEGLSGIAIGYEESDKHHTFLFSDNGAGIAGIDCEKIFEPFQRNTALSDIEGTGLGLSIVKEIAEKHRGTVRAEAGHQGGATFYVTISKRLKKVRSGRPN
jgi:signal transduction histidine kinase